MPPMNRDTKAALLGAAVVAYFTRNVWYGAGVLAAWAAIRARQIQVRGYGAPEQDPRRIRP